MYFLKYFENVVSSYRISFSNRIPNFGFDIRPRKMDEIVKSPTDAFLQQWVSENLTDSTVNVPTDMVELSYLSTIEPSHSVTDTELMEILQNAPSESLTELEPSSTECSPAVTELVPNNYSSLEDNFSSASILSSTLTELQFDNLLSNEEYISKDKSMSDDFSVTIYQQSTENIGNIFAYCK